MVEKSVVGNSRQIFSYNALRGLCAVGIFCHHNSYLADAASPVWESLYNGFFRYGSSCTSFFFILSGFLLAYTWKGETFKSFIGGRLKRIYPLTLLVFILAFATSFVFTDTVNGTLATGSPLWITSIVLNLTMLKAYVPIESVFYSFHGPSWYISVLIIFYVVGYFVVMRIKSSRTNSTDRHKGLYKLGGVILLVYLLQLVLCVIVDVKGLSGARLYLTYVNPYFHIFGEGMLGVFLCECMPEIQERIKGWNKNALEIITFFVFVGFFLLHNVVKSSIWSAWIWFIPVACLLIAYNKDSGIFSRWMRGSPWQFLGNISFELYMTHAFVYEGLPYVVGVISSRMQTWVVYHAGIRFIITLALSIVFAWIIHILLKWFNKQFLSPNRSREKEVLERA